MRAFTVGLTGGIASGKSTVARLFADLGVPVIDTDDVAREVVMPGKAALAAVVASFGRQFLDSSGQLDRRRLRAHVFAHPAERARLEAILHPYIEKETLAALDRAAGPYQLVVVPLLIESGFDRHVDRILVVDCAVATQRSRLALRDRSSAQEVERMLAAQLTRKERLRQADDVLTNDGTLEELRHAVAQLHQRYLYLATAHAAAGG